MLDPKKYIETNKSKTTKKNNVKIIQLGLITTIISFTFLFKDNFNLFEEVLINKDSTYIILIIILSMFLRLRREKSNS
jgi:hypothetical protein